MSRIDILQALAAGRISVARADQLLDWLPHGPVTIHYWGLAAVTRRVYFWFIGIGWLLVGAGLFALVWFGAMPPPGTTLDEFLGFDDSMQPEGPERVVVWLIDHWVWVAAAVALGQTIEALLMFFRFRALEAEQAERVRAVRHELDAALE